MEVRKWYISIWIWWASMKSRLISPKIVLSKLFIIILLSWLCMEAMECSFFVNILLTWWPCQHLLEVFDTDKSSSLWPIPSSYSSSFAYMVLCPRCNIDVCGYSKIKSILANKDQECCLVLSLAHLLWKNICDWTAFLQLYLVRESVNHWFQDLQNTDTVPIQIFSSIFHSVQHVYINKTISVKLFG